MRKVETTPAGSSALTGRHQTFSYILPPGTGFAVGDFSFEVDSGLWNWSEGSSIIHGFEPGDVVPTTGLVLAHKHPADRDEFERIFRGVVTDGGTMVSHHRIIDGTAARAGSSWLGRAWKMPAAAFVPSAGTSST